MSPEFYDFILHIQRKQSLDFLVGASAKKKEKKKRLRCFPTP